MLPGDSKNCRVNVAPEARVAFQRPLLMQGGPLVVVWLKPAVFVHRT